METIKFSPPDISQEEINEVIDVLKSGWITTGLKVKLFEREIAKYCGTKSAVCMNSATACMELTLRLLGVGPGDEVITSAYTYSASCSVIYHVGATPVLVDTGENTYEMDYEKLEAAITERTKVIIPVDIAGVPCDYERIFEAVERKKSLFRAKNELQRAYGRVITLADSAHAFGASRGGKMCGSIADFTSFSFHAVKNLTCAEGGAVTWRPGHGVDCETIYNKLILLSLHGQSKDALSKTKPGNWEYDIVLPGYKCNMTDLMAGLGLAQLRRYEKLQARRREIIEIYNKGLAGLPVEVLKHFSVGNKSSGHLYFVRVDGASEVQRNEIIEEMAKRNVSTNVHYKPLPMFTAYRERGFEISDYPNAFNMYKNEITLPLHTLLTDEQVEYVIESFKGSLISICGG